MEPKSQENRREARHKRVKKGLVILNTGPGKGKTTAALGVLLRAWGRGWRICVIQFIKHETGEWGEVRAAKKLGIDITDMKEALKRAKSAFSKADFYTTYSESLGAKNAAERIVQLVGNTSCQLANSTQFL